MSIIPRLITEQEAAEALGVSRRFLQKARATGTGPRYLKLSGIERNGSVRYRPEDIAAWIESKEAMSTHEVKHRGARKEPKP
jgi:predicted DNA-binding transcriptional regulator AlpA